MIETSFTSHIFAACVSIWSLAYSMVSLRNLKFSHLAHISAISDPDSSFDNMNDAVTHKIEVASGAIPKPSTVPKPSTGTNKRSKKDPPSPVSSSLSSMDVILAEIRALKPFMEETTRTLQHLDEKWSVLESRVVLVEQKVESFNATSSRVSNLESEVALLKRHAEDLENRNRRNNLRIYGLPESLEGSNPTTFFQTFLPKLLGLPSTSPLNIQRAHRLGPEITSKPRGIILFFLQFTD